MLCKDIMRRLRWKTRFFCILVWFNLNVSGLRFNGLVSFTDDARPLNAFFPRRELMECSEAVRRARDRFSVRGGPGFRRLRHGFSRIEN